MKIENRVLLELQQINKNLFELNKRSQDILTALQPKIFEMIQPIKVNQDCLKDINLLLEKVSRS
mgnify:FL=1